MQDDLLGNHQVVASLSFIGIDDGSRADLEVAFRLFELLRNCPLLRLVDLEVHLRQQHFEIGLGDSQDQVLARKGELRLALGDLGPGLLVLHQVLHAEEWLRQADAEEQRVELLVRRIPEVAVIELIVSGNADVRQQERPPLDDRLLPGLP